MDKLQDQYFLFSRSLNNPKEFFQGYCFHDSNYIYGREGYEKYKSETGISIAGGEDGCYVLMKNEGSSFQFSSDYYGYKKIFYYWQEDFWVVSNSVYLIAEHLKSNNIELKVNYSQLAYIGRDRKGFFFDQLFSLNTFIENVKILPIGHELFISDECCRVVKNDNNLVFTTYEEGLSYFLGVWVSRIAGLLANDIHVRADLTGGLDSRAVFAIVKKATELSDSNNIPAFNTGTTVNNKIDLEIATEITEFYGFPINKLKAPAISRFSAYESFESWKILCLGVYHPIYLPGAGPQYNLVSLSGGGAENHRPLYSFNNAETFIKRHIHEIRPNWLNLNILNDFKFEIRRISNSSSMEPMIQHYREYRNRIHTGRNSQYKTTFNPLGSKILDALSEIAGSDRIANGQINYDIMATLLPSILDIRFDNPTKSLTSAKERSLTKLPFWDSFPIGKAYYSGNVSIEPSARNISSLNVLKENFDNSKNIPFVKDFFGNDYIKAAETIMEAAITNNGFVHSVEARGISAVIAASVFG